SRWLIVAVFITAMLVTWLWGALLPDNFQQNESSDYIGFYEPLASSLLAGNGFRQPDGAPSTRYPPGFPILLAGVFEISKILNVPRAVAVSAFILICTGLTAVLVFLLARIIWKPIPAIVASLIWITYPLGLWLAKQPNSELPFMVVLYAAMLILFREVTRQN